MLVFNPLNFCVSCLIQKVWEITINPLCHVICCNRRGFPVLDIPSKIPIFSVKFHDFLNYLKHIFEYFRRTEELFLVVPALHIQIFSVDVPIFKHFFEWFIFLYPVHLFWEVTLMPLYVNDGNLSRCCDITINNYNYKCSRNKNCTNSLFSVLSFFRTFSSVS